MSDVAVFIDGKFATLARLPSKTHADGFQHGIVYANHLYPVSVCSYRLPEQEAAMRHEQDASQAQAAIDATVELPPF